MTCNNIILSQPETGANVSHEIPDDVSARLNFSPADISGLRLGSEGELIVSFNDGGQLSITNFSDLIDNGNLLYLEDGTLVDPAILTSSLKGPENFNSIETAAGTTETVTIAQPEAGTKQQVIMTEGGKYVCDFDPASAAKVEIIDGNMVLTFADGSQVIFDNYTEIMAGDLPPELTVADGTVIEGDELLTQVTEVEQPTEEVLEVVEKQEEPKPEQVANIAPAAGEEMDAVAEALAEVEPAAGETGRTSNSGYGFNSTPRSLPLDSPLAIGPLGPTQLVYGAPQTQGDLPFLTQVSQGPQDDTPDVEVDKALLDETNLASGNLVATGSVNADYGNDTPGQILPNGVFVPSANLTGGTLSSGGVAISVFQTANGYEGYAGAILVFTFEIDSATGDYTYTQFEQFDHSDTTNDNENIRLDFGVAVIDNDGDTVNVTVQIDILDDAPVVVSQPAGEVDETAFTGGPLVETGQFFYDPGQDVPETVSANGNFAASGSVAGGSLTSNGVPVTVSFAANVYTATAGGDTVFTLEFNPLTSAYTYTQFKPLDHADTADHDDVIALEFGVDVVDFDGDTTGGNILVNVRDDGPVTGDDENTIDETDLGPIVITDSVSVNFGGDGAGSLLPSGSFAASGSVDNSVLSHNGVAVTVTATANGYVGTAGADTIFSLELDPNTGDYTFTLFKSLDHADDNDANDVITLTFGTEITDFDGDSEPGQIIVNIKDDAPEFQPNGPQPDSGLETVDETDLGPIVETGTLVADFGEDAPGSYEGDGSFTPGGSLLSGNLTSCGFAVTVTFDAQTNTYTGVADNATVFTLVIDGSTGDYTFTQISALDHADPNDPDDIITLTFGVDAVDSEGEKAGGVIQINVKDDAPELNPVYDVVDETDLGPVSVSGTITADYGNDTAAQTDPFVTTGSFNSSGSQLGGTLTQNGVLVTVAFDSNTGTYTGTAGANTVFTMVIDNAGSYNFTLLGPLDHADPNDPNDIINLDFGVAAQDKDGDKTESFVRIYVKDDVPSIGDSAGDVDETNFDQGPLVYQDTLFTNFGVDLAKVEPAGGFEACDDQGNPLALTYTNGTNTFPITVTQTATGYQGVATGAGNLVIFDLVIDENTGSYTYTQYEEIVHPDTTDHDDTIDLKFDVQVTATDNTTDSGTITITVADDGPLARDDFNAAEENQTITGDVVANDDFSQDNPNTVQSIAFNGTTYPLNGTSAVVVADFGTLTINADGTYSYTAINNPTGGSDIFEYVLVDSDGDTSPATLKIDVEEDGIPVSVYEELSVDETDLTPGPETYSGTLTIDAGIDGFGSVDPNGGFSFSGSALNNQLTSSNVPVVVTAAGNTYTGSAGGETIFTLEIDENTGDYLFTLVGTLDHADATDPNDVIKLDFGVTVTDKDGDTADGEVTIYVHDDAPVAYDDKFCVTSGNEKPPEVELVVNNNVDDVCVKEDGTVLVPVEASYTGGDGNEVLTITLEDVVGNGWTITAPGWTAVGNDLQITLPAGQQNYSGNITFAPPADSDADLPNLKAVASVFNPDTNMSEVAFDHFNVITDAVVDNPDVAASAGNGSGYYAWYYTSTAYIGLNVSAAVNDLDGSETITKIVIDLNDTFNTGGRGNRTNYEEMGAYLNKGVEVSPGIWEITVNGQDAVSELSGLQMIIPWDGSVHNQTSGNTYLHNYYGVGNHTADIKVDFYVEETTLSGEEKDYTDNALIITKEIPITMHLTPLVLDLDGDGVELLDVNDGVFFDMAVDGSTLDQTAWAGPDDGMLAIDNDGDGRITDRSELFGNTQGFADGFDKLASFDSNNDGFITANDNQFGDLLIWKDTNTDGVSQSSELFTLTELGVSSIAVNATGANYQISGQDIILESTFTINGQTHSVVDALFNNINGDDLTSNNANIDGASQTNVIKASVLHNDELSEDTPSTITAVVFNGQTFVVPANGSVTVDGLYGTLVMNFDGKFTYTADSGITSQQTEVFTYHLTDYDGDTDTAELELCVKPGEVDDTPIVIQPGIEVVDETGGFDTVSGTIQVDYGNDAPGTVDPNGAFSSSVTNLLSYGYAVSVSVVGNSYIGVANGQTVFTLEVLENGNYTFTQLQQLDHPDAADHNDAITLNFGATATDNDGDTADTTVIVKVLDDGPQISSITNVLDESDFGLNQPLVASGTVPHSFGQDDAGSITPSGLFEAKFQMGGANVNLTSGGVPVVVSNTANGYIGTVNGQTAFTFEIDAQSGDYNYTQHVPIDHPNASDPDDVIWLKFFVDIHDKDGDVDTAPVIIDLHDDGPVANDDMFCVTSGGNENDAPEIGDDQKFVDETGGFDVVTGIVNLVDYGNDGPGSVGANGQFGSSYALTSYGYAVSVVLNGNTYTGTANGETIFTLAVNNDGSYTFTQLKQLDHADDTDHDDVLSLDFGVQISDVDGDTDQGNITIDVYDDGPQANSESYVGQLSYVQRTWNLLANDDAGADEGLIMSKFAGRDIPEGGSITVYLNTSGGITGSKPTWGWRVTADSDGHLTVHDGYRGIRGRAPGLAPDIRVPYEIQDKDGDTDTATVRLAENRSPLVLDLDGDGVELTSTQNGVFFDMDVNGSTLDQTGWAGPDDGFLAIDNNNDGRITDRSELFGDTQGFADGFDKLGSFDSNNDGFITANDNRFGELLIWKDANTDGVSQSSELFTLAQLGISSIAVNAANVNYQINGQSVLFQSTFTINGQTQTIVDAYFDSISGDALTNNNANIDGASETNVIKASVLHNDELSADTANTITSVFFDDQGFIVPANGSVTVNGLYGTLVMNSDGTFTYTADDGIAVEQTEVFKYTLTDADGDTSIAELKLCVKPGQGGPDDEPVVLSSTETVDETDGFDTVTGTVNVDYGNDGPGTISANGGFDSSYALTSCGYAVSVALNGNTYTGTANGEAIFTLTVLADGSYTFTQLKQLDHWDTGDHDDKLWMNFGVTATDNDGDTGDGFITINVFDDGPYANNDSFSGQLSYVERTWDLFANDSAGQDGGLVMTKFAGRDIPEGGSVTLYLDLNGNVVGSRPSIGWHVTAYSDGNLTVHDGLRTGSRGIGSSAPDITVVYEVKDKDGDRDTATVRLDENRSPLVLDLDGDGVELVNVENGVQFDIDNDGDLEQTAWAAADDGLLALDKDGDGVIEDRSELFGDTDGFTDGFDNLSSYDSNDDGVIDANDDVFDNLVVWQDANQDGVSDASELLTLQQIGIVSINLNATQPEDLYIEGSWISHVSSYTTTDGETHEVVDAWFSYSENPDDAVLSATPEADTFIFEAIRESAAEIQGFDVIEDAIDLSQLIQGDDAVTDAIGDFVQLHEEDGSTVISVDVDGANGPAEAVEVAKLQDVTGANVEELVSNGTIIV